MKQINRDAAKQTILAMFRRTVRPVLIGPASVELKLPLSWVEDLFNDLVSEQKIRECTQRELSQFDIRHGFLVEK